MRPPVDHIAAPPFPRKATWFNVAPLRMDQQVGRPVLVEFWDFCRPNSIRTLSYLRTWHERYAEQGLRVIGVHASGFPPSADPDAVGEAVQRLDVTWPVVVDGEYEIWNDYGNLGWPARYLWNREGLLFDFHYGEGAYDETEAAIAELLEVEPAPPAPVRPEDAPGAVLVPQSEDQEGPYSGPYEAAGVWAVVDGHGVLSVNGEAHAVEHPGALELIRHPVSTEGVLALEPGPGVTVHATVFTPGLAG